MAILNGVLQLIDPVEKKSIRMPIDYFFRSLAQDKKEKAICIVLSGMGTDGTLGLKEIKAELGMAIVQEPGTAKYGNMPRSAIETDMADYILTPEKMPKQLILYAQHPFLREREAIAILNNDTKTVNMVMSDYLMPYTNGIELL